jgi:MEMO1 family protein
MQELTYAALVPHPPILIEAVGAAEAAAVTATRGALARVAKEAAAREPDAVIIISPHGPVFRDAVAVEARAATAGDLGQFGAPEVRLDLPVAQELAYLVMQAVETAGIPTAAVTAESAAEWGAAQLDHGSLVPLWLLQQAGLSCPVLPVAVSMLPRHRLYAVGQAIQAALEAWGRRAVVLASGDLAHRLSPAATLGYHPAAGAFEQQVLAALAEADLAALFAIDPVLCEQAAECGLRSLLILSGVLDGIRVEPRLYSYEAPFGVGYAVVSFNPDGPDPARHLTPHLEAARRERIQSLRASEHPVVRLARTAVEHRVREGLELDLSAGAPYEGTALPFPPGPDGLPDRAGVFVSLKVDGVMRGCMGTDGPTRPSLALEIMQAAVDAAVGDDRFPPVEPEELDDLQYTVDILADPEPVTGPADLAPNRYGLLAVDGDARGLILPDMDGVETPEQQVALACEKAGTSPDSPAIRLYRFAVRRFR